MIRWIRRRGWLDWALPFLSDDELRKFYLRYKYETPEMITRKRNVCRDAVARGGPGVAKFERKGEVLWVVDSKAQWRKRRREFRAEMFEWLKLPGAIGGFVAGLWAVWQLLERYVL